MDDKEKKEATDKKDSTTEAPKKVSTREKVRVHFVDTIFDEKYQNLLSILVIC